MSAEHSLSIRTTDIFVPANELDLSCA